MVIIIKINKIDNGNNKRCRTVTTVINVVAIITTVRTGVTIPVRQWSSNNNTRQDYKFSLNKSDKVRKWLSDIFDSSTKYTGYKN